MFKHEQRVEDFVEDSREVVHMTSLGYVSAAAAILSGKSVTPSYLF